MVTPDGYLYSREALLENLLQQKKAIKKRQAAYEAQQQDEAQKVCVCGWLLAVGALCRMQAPHALSADRTHPPPVPCSSPPSSPQAAEQAAVQAEAALIAFDRQNHMGISSKTAQKITDAISAEAATMHEAKGTKAVVSIKENEEKMKQLRVSGGRIGGWVEGAEDAAWGACQWGAQAGERAAHSRITPTLTTPTTTSTPTHITTRRSGCRARPPPQRTC
jgi:nitric oxide synthase-interacting protein